MSLQHVMPSPGRPRNIKVTLHTVHDRKAQDLLTNAMVAPAIVDDPLEIGGKLEVLRSLRDDPLAHLRARNFIDDAQFMAGREWQKHYERSGIGGVRAIDFTREAVDGGRFADSLTDTQRAAIVKLGKLDRKLGQEGCALVRDILGKGWGLVRCAVARGLDSSTDSRHLKYLGRRFRECLDVLAVELGFATGGR